MCVDRKVRHGRTLRLRITIVFYEDFVNRQYPTIESIKEKIQYIDQRKREGLIYCPYEIGDDTLKDELKELPYYKFIIYADYHYFVSRILFLNEIFEYSAFAGYQCIENYLKATIKYFNEIPKKTHRLSSLLNHCISLSPEGLDFLRGNEIKTIISKYDPFYSMSRYPISNIRIDAYLYEYPDDIYLLDYFVYRFKELLPFPNRYRSVFNGDHYLINSCKENSPDVFSLFTKQNINFITENQEQ